jgi:alkylation response protein AidB-like acyl-CoA dehydrogenase
MGTGLHSGRMPLDMLDEARRLSSHIRAVAPEVERDRAVPEELVRSLAELGVFRLATPRGAGGLEADPMAMFEVFEELGKADGSVGWCAMIGATTGTALGYLDEDTATGMLGDPRFLLAGVAAALGRATAVPGGYLVRGRWPFASACQQATWLVGGCVQTNDGAGRGPRVVHVLMPRDDLTIHDTWDVLGLRGTGSHDIEADDVFVPEAYAFSLTRIRQTGPLYRFPIFGLLALGVGAVALGVARAAVDEFVELSGDKWNPATGQSLAAKPAAQATLAEAEALVGAGRAYLVSTLRECWARVAGGDELPNPDRARLRLAIAHATTSAAQAVDLVYHAGGGTTLYAMSPLQRYFRDVHMATQHAMVNTDVLELVGAVLLGQPAEVHRL